MTYRFGIRKQPKWAKNDIDAHQRLESELQIALQTLPRYVPCGLTEEIYDITFDQQHFQSLCANERGWYFFNYALRLQRTYVFIMEMMEPFCRVNWTYRPNEDGFSILLIIEDRQYACNYLNDHICGLSWVVGKINFHIKQFVQGRS